MDDSRLTPRKMQILKAVVDAHIAGGEPVGSKYLAKEVNISASPATIRNEMAELEEMGYIIYALVSTHTLQVLNFRGGGTKWTIQGSPREKCKFSRQSLTPT